MIQNGIIQNIVDQILGGAPVAPPLDPPLVWAVLNRTGVDHNTPTA